VFDLECGRSAIISRDMPFQGYDGIRSRASSPMVWSLEGFDRWQALQEATY
jgi:hypothetical protein